jgi:hypothetical protein
MKKVEYWRYNKKKKTWKKINKFQYRLDIIKKWFKKWIIIDKSQYTLIPNSELGRWFKMSEKEYKESERLYKEEHRTISYEFYPCAGIGWGLKIHDLKTKETFDITDYSRF